jgi:hypothetical protein
MVLVRQDAPFLACYPIGIFPELIFPLGGFYVDLCMKTAIMIMAFSFFFSPPSAKKQGF